MLVNTPAIANCIREGKTFMIPGCIQTGKAQGMILMDDSLRALHQAGLITTEDCILPRGRQNHHEILPGNQVTFNFETLLLWLSSTNTSNIS